MAILTWKNVDAPDFSSASRSSALAAEMLSRSLGQAGDAFNNFNKANEDIINRNVRTAAMGITNQGEFEQALQSGAFLNGIRPDQLNEQTIGLLQRRPDDLLARAVNEQRYDQNAATFENQQTEFGNRQEDRTRLLAEQELAKEDQAALDYLIRDAGEQVVDGSTALDYYNLAKQSGLDDRVLNRLATQLGAMVGGSVTGPGRIDLMPAPTNEQLRNLTTNLGQVSTSDALMQALFEQESGNRQVDANGRTITSVKGALGAAQIMPGTAPEAAALAGLPYDPQRLKTDAEYNKALGTAYLNKQLQDFGGSPALALAAYNAGPGKVQEWIQKFGDPRTGAISEEEFIQKIPFKETREYVPKILNKAASRQGTGGYTPEMFNSVQAMLSKSINEDVRNLGEYLPEYRDDKRSVEEVTADFVKRFRENGRDVNQNQVSSMIGELARDNGINPAQAALLLERNFGTNPNRVEFIDNVGERFGIPQVLTDANQALFGGISQWAGIGRESIGDNNGAGVNRNALRQQAQAIRANQDLGIEVETLRRRELLNRLETGQKQYEAALQNYARMARSGNQVAADRALQQVRQTEQAMQLLHRAVTGDPNLDTRNR